MSELHSAPNAARLDRTSPPDQIREIIDTLFGHSEVLDQHLLPAISSKLNDTPLSSYMSFIDLCDEVVSSWDYEKKGQFLYGHPEIGAPKVTGLSAKEQGTAQVNPVTIERLQRLNAEYREIFPGLIYLTFVNGRSREAIAEELEAFLAQSQSSSRIHAVKSPRGPVTDNADGTTTKPPSSPEWKTECDRGVRAVIEISRDRLKKLGWDQSA